jgi:hypothetical protein
VNTTQPTPKDVRADASRLFLAELEDLEKYLGPDKRLRTAEIGARLNALRLRLKDEFRNEERDGYLPDVLARAPQLGRNAEKLLGEHADLTRSLEDLVARVRAAEHLDDNLRERLRAWIQRLREHESAENVLVEDAFNVECAAED